VVIDPAAAYRAAITTETLPNAQLVVDIFSHPPALHDFYAWCADTNIPEVHTLAGTIEAWWPETLLFLQTGLTNARTEGINRVVKDVGRRACGFRNPRNHRRRVRLICTRRRRMSAMNQRLPG
jgi:hypothetical protein